MSKSKRNSNALLSKEMCNALNVNKKLSYGRETARARLTILRGESIWG